MTTEQVAKELRRVTDERDRGAVSLTDYRRLRAELLDGLLGLDKRPDIEATRPRQTEPLHAGQKTPTRIQKTGPVPAPPVARAAVPVPTPSPAQGATAPARPNVALIGGLAALAVVAAGAWWWLGRAPSATTAAEPGAALEGAPTTDTSSGPSPVDVFLTRGDWSDSAVSALNSAWWSMSDREILATLTSDGAHRLAEDVAARLKAHATPGGPGTLDPDAPLILLARNLNVPVPSAAIGPRSAASAEPAARAVPAAARAAAAATPAAAAARPAAVAAVPAAPAAPAKPGAVPSAAPAVPVTPALAASGAPDPCASAKRRRCRDELGPGRAGPDLIVLPPGHFRMGSTLAPEEQPVHEVAVLRPFAMTRAEITVGQWKVFCEATGRSCTASGADEQPVVNVSWKDATDYARWLSDQTGRHYRLPSEAEWEYAARADTAGEPGHELPALNPNTDARYAAPGGPQPAAPTAEDDPTFKANGFGLLHLLGNVREWVQDPWIADYQHASADAGAREGAGSVRVVRGGSFRDGPERVRPGARDHLESAARDAQTGFRLARDVR